MYRKPRLSFIAGCLLSASAISHAAERGPLPITAGNLSAVLDSDSYGYDVTCLINGHNIGIKGGSSESLRQFDEKSHEVSTDPHDQNQYSTLHIGRNTVRITYRKRAKEPFGLDINLQVFGYPAPLFYAHVKDGDGGSFEGVFDIDAIPAKTFKPLYFTNEDPAHSGFLFAHQDPPATGSYSAKLNGGDEVGETGQPSLSAPLHGFHPGANQLAVTYTTKGGPIRLVVVGPGSTSVYVLESAQEAHSTFVIQEPAVDRKPLPEKQLIFDIGAIPPAWLLIVLFLMLIVGPLLEIVVLAVPPFRRRTGLRRTAYVLLSLALRLGFKPNQGLEESRVL